MSGERLLPSIEQSAVQNGLLAALPPAAFTRLAPHLQPVELRLRQILNATDQPIEHAYFVESGLTSMIALLEEGGSVEVGIVGREGVVGLPLVLGDDRADKDAMVQLAGSALRLPAAVLCRAFDETDSLRDLLLRYMQAFHVQVSQTAACNGRHVLEERLARWLLMTHDRAGGDAFLITQEFLADMLGVRRAGVTVAAGILQRAGVIRYGHGRLAVLDRAGLEAASCECYGVARRRFERLLGRGAGK
ncbi:MAG: Crp/Fnr family transcriptional regulator [Geminicoccaceae bacterium]|nr:Crp/Fnr family transcriptional regulator [Geminicoccaceae bacterium]